VTPLCTWRHCSPTRIYKKSSESLTAYDRDAIRDDLDKPSIKLVIRPRSNGIKMIRYNKRLYREHNCSERIFGHLKINR
jgi:hypothetical protein